MHDDLIERIEGARTDADYAASVGETGDASCIFLTREDCTAISKFLTKAFRCALLGERNPEVADTIALLSGAFAGEDDDDE